MKTIFNTLFGLILFSWIIISGTAYTSSTCGDSEDSRNSSKSAFASTIETTFSSCADTSHCWALLFNTSSKKDPCCKKNECAVDGDCFLNTQKPNFHTSAIFLAYTSQRYQDNRALHPDVDRHKTRQPIPIYTIIQSFLC